MRRIAGKAGRGLLTALYILLALLLLAPIVYMLVHAFLSTREAVYRASLDFLPFRLLPERPGLSQFAAALGDPEYYVYFRNSVFLSRLRHFEPHIFVYTGNQAGCDCSHQQEK